MKQTLLLVMVALLCICNAGVAMQSQLNALKPSDNTSEQIGNSYFISDLKEPISQIGGAIESYQFHSEIYDSLLYVFFNQLMANHVFYEVRAYGVYNYLSQILVPDSQALTSRSTALQQHLLGYGGVGILGYNINITPDVAMLPSIRVGALTNTFIAYTDSLGNNIGSNDYTVSIGTKLSKRCSDVFAVYGLGFIGYQWSLITGNGVFAHKAQANANVYFVGLEGGAPYKMTKALSLTPYLQYVPAWVNLNNPARRATSAFGQPSGAVTVYGFKVGYEF
ncbi:MAG: hypothetical protein NTW08_09475 [Gammaproteobacteria bacterium]|nr:hypothetical protein [Gammaproteobacteria bacterium]